MPNWEKFIIALLINLILIYVVFTVIDYVDKKVRKAIFIKEEDSPLLRFIPILINSLKAITVFIAMTGLLQSQGYSISSILAGFGIGGIAVGMAAKDALANIFGSIEILSDRVYKIGDYVKINDVEGYVEDINMRSTKVRDLDNFLINIPNNITANTIITNVSRAKKRFLNLSFGVTYSTTCEKIQLAQQILKDVALAHKDIHNDFTVDVHSLSDSSINIRFRGYVKSGIYKKFLKVRGEFLSEVVSKFRSSGIDFAFPSQSIYIEGSSIEN